MLTNRKLKTIDGNTAAAYVSYAFTELAFVYPITPSSAMADVVDRYSELSRKENLFGNVVKVIEMQSEAGVAGALHGALTSGSLATTYTASQGLLLMIPNMHKIAGELLPCAIHVAARTVAGHALSIFGDHSDVYACRQTGFAMLCSNSPQEVMDLSAIAHLCAIKSRIPFLHFFDGFRTSHEIQKVQMWDYKDLKDLLDFSAVYSFKNRALNPENPVLRGSAQNDDIFFQVKEAGNIFYFSLPHIVENYMHRINEKIGTDYNLFNYYGHSEPERVIVAMGSVCETIEEVVDYLNKTGERVGLVKVRLYRPFSKEHFLKVLPKSVKVISVLDRAKEPGSLGEPLYLDVCSSLFGTKFKDVKIFRGRYGLSSKDTSPKDIIAVFDNMKINSVSKENYFNAGKINNFESLLSCTENNDSKNVCGNTLEKNSLEDFCKEREIKFFQTGEKQVATGKKSQMEDVTLQKKDDGQGSADSNVFEKDALGSFCPVKETTLNLSKDHFTLGIKDDVTNLSLGTENISYTFPEDIYSCKFWGLGSDGTVSANKNTIKIIGDNTDLFVQGYFAYDSKKSGGLTVSHLRFGKSKIKSTYYVTSADFVACHNFSYIFKYPRIIKEVKKGGKLLLNCPYSNEKDLENNLPEYFKYYVFKNNIELYLIDAEKIAKEIGLNRKVNTILQAAFFKITGLIDLKSSKNYMKEAAKKTYGEKGEKIVAMNFLAIEKGMEMVKKISTPESFSKAKDTLTEIGTNKKSSVYCPLISYSYFKDCASGVGGFSLVSGTINEVSGSGNFDASNSEKNTKFNKSEKCTSFGCEKCSKLGGLGSEPGFLENNSACFGPANSSKGNFVCPLVSFCSLCSLNSNDQFKDSEKNAKFNKSEKGASFGCERCSKLGGLGSEPGFLENNSACLRLANSSKDDFVCPLISWGSSCSLNSNDQVKDSEKNTEFSKSEKGASFGCEKCSKLGGLGSEPGFLENNSACLRLANSSKGDFVCPIVSFCSSCSLNSNGYPESKCIREYLHLKKNKANEHGICSDCSLHDNPDNLLESRCSLKKAVCRCEGASNFLKKYKDACDFTNNIQSVLNRYEGNDLPVSEFLPYLDGTLPLGTSSFEKRDIATSVPVWDKENCIQCNMCSLVCPHAVIRPFILTKKEIEESPYKIVCKEAIGFKDENLYFCIGISSKDCTSCGLCENVCPGLKQKKALKIIEKNEKTDEQQKQFNYLVSLPEKNIVFEKFNKFSVKGSQFKKPLLEFSGACAGCGETPYAKLITQLFGPDIYIANATGCSSIWGGSAGSIPYTFNLEGHGPAWQNSLFEDNAEFGFGIEHSRKYLRRSVEKSIERLAKISDDSELKSLYEKYISTSNSVSNNAVAAKDLVDYIESGNLSEAILSLPEAKVLREKILRERHFFSKKSVWIFGGDGWAYDIGFGGLDHVFASGENINILVFDTEVYSNTGGQASKATPKGAVAQFACGGKKTKKKNLAAMAISYESVYVASVALGANMSQCIRAFKEASNYNGVSLIVAYSPCIEHGIKGSMVNALLEQKKAVECGHWSLFRFNPSLKIEGKDPLIMDSNSPSKPYEEFLRNERRFRNFLGK